MLAGLAILLLWEMRSMRRQHADSIAELSGSLAEFQAADEAIESHLAGPVLKDVTGRVVDETGAPLADVDLLTVVKTWPGGMYRQQDYHTTSDKDGAFSLEQLLPVGEQHAVQIAALRSGYALTSKYELIEPGASAAVGSMTLELVPAQPMQLAIEDAQGNRLSGVRIAPHSRATDDCQVHTVYFQATNPIHTTTDENGQVAIDWCTGGDLASLFVQLPDRRWERYSAKIPNDDAESLVLTIRQDHP